MLPTRTRTIVAVVSAAAWLALAGSTQARVSRDFVGVASEDVFAGSPAYRTSNLSAQGAIGIGLLRQTFDWSTIERSPGIYSFGTYDEYVAAAAAHGVKILPILFNPPSFYARRSGRATCQPTSNAAMGRFAAALVRRYGPSGSLWRERPGIRKLSIRSWQVWNEPSLGGLYWCGRTSPRAYAAMLRVVGRAIKRVDRRAEIVTAGIPPSKLRRAVPIIRYLRGLYAAGGARYFNTLAINSYATSSRELGRLLRSVRALMNSRGDRGARIWITELGWATGGPRHRFNVGLSGQARRISSSFALVRRERRRLRLRGLVYFSWRDSAPYAPLFNDQWGLHTGLLDINGGQKPGYFAFKRAVSRLR